MKVKLLHTTGNQDILETIWDKPEPAKDEVEVKSVLTGVCSSDVAMYNAEVCVCAHQTVLASVLACWDQI